MELPELDKLEPAMKWKQGNIPVTFEAIGVDLSIDDRWPSYFSCKPAIGEIVESLNGRRLAIKGLVHSVENTIAVLKVILGKDDGGQHEESGTVSEVNW